MTPQQLKNSILQQAIEGKLVEQRPEEGTGEELYQQIQKEKQKLIKEGKIKKEKPLPPITEEEVPFEIPESWKWVKLGNIFKTSSGTTPSKGNRDYYTNGTVNWVRTTDLNNSVLDNCSIKITSQAMKDCNLKLIPINSVCVAMYGGAGTIGKNALIEFSTTINQSVCAIHPNDFCNMKYLLYYLQCRRSSWMDFAAGSRKDPNINQIIIKNFLLSLPPLAEQKRIVAKIEELQPYLDQYEQAYNRLESFNKKFPDDMKKSILQMAIEGKLVEQRSEEGTGEELYQQIQKEKQKLIKEGKIKKGKSLPSITEEEIPFEIPESWKWVRLPEIASCSLGKTLNNSKDNGDLKPYLCSINIQDNGISLDVVKEALFNTAEQRKYLLQKNDLLICEGGDAGRAAIWNRETEMYYQNALHRIRFYTGIDSNYFLLCLKFYKYDGTILAHCKGVTIKHLVQSSLSEIWFPLPPFVEQKRIVAKVEELLPLCDQLKQAEVS